MPDIAGERISPLIHDGIRELGNTLVNDDFKRKFMKLCDALVELLHIEVMGAEIIPTPPPESDYNKSAVPNFINGQNDKCPTCGNIIDLSNKSLICKECGTRFCTTCEEWFREERKRGQEPLCEDCFTAEQDRLERERKEKVEQEIRLKAEQEKKEREDAERKKREEEEALLREEKVRHEKLAKEGNSIGMKFTLVSDGEFMMGSEDEHDFEKPVHKVTINKPFYLGTYPVTQREWKAVMGDNPSIFIGDDLPVEQVSWDDVQEFIRKLNDKEGTDKYRLPSEAEWEYACRAETTTKYCFGDGESKLGEYAWCNINSGRKTHPVGQKKPNSFGLYDMYGNVWEWVQDKWHDDYKGAPSDGSVWESGDGSNRVFRGGVWYGNARNCRSAVRRNNDPGFRSSDLGFRLLRIL